MRTIIAGGRDFNDYDMLSDTCKTLFSKTKDVIILSGGAKGADTLGERFAKENNYPCEVFKADWDNLGKQAGYTRNMQMGLSANALVAFWDGKSKGTKHMIDIAKTLNLKLRIIKY